MTEALQFHQRTFRLLRSKVAIEVGEKTANRLIQSILLFFAFSWFTQASSNTQIDIRSPPPFEQSRLISDISAAKRIKTSIYIVILFLRLSLPGTTPKLEPIKIHHGNWIVNKKTRPTSFRSSFKYDTGHTHTHTKGRWHRIRRISNFLTSANQFWNHPVRRLQLMMTKKQDDFKSFLLILAILRKCVLVYPLKLPNPSVDKTFLGRVD